VRDTDLAGNPKVQSILISNNRRLAMVDGRIVGIGDDVGGWTVGAIEQNAIVLRSPGGKERRIGIR
jgi:hypothetical protein